VTAASASASAPLANPKNARWTASAACPIQQGFPDSGRLAACGRGYETGTRARLISSYLEHFVDSDPNASRVG
jgi:hypothetical protein